MTRKKTENSVKAQHEQLRERMRGYGCPVAQIAVELARRFNLRPRTAWRCALGWSQWKLAQHYNRLHPKAKLSDSRVSACESWPHGGRAPSVHYLARLATTYGHGCTPGQLADADDLEHLDPAERTLLTTGYSTAFTATSPLEALSDPRSAPDRALHAGIGDTGLVWAPRRAVLCDARGMPLRKEVIMAGEESTHFRRWSATTNVTDTILEQMSTDVAELARDEQIDPPATTYARLLGARDDVFRLIGGRQPPRHTATLYKIASQVTALLAMVTFDLDHPNTASAHARTALHCVEMSGYTPIRVFIRYVQSNIAFSAGRYDEAAELIDAALPDATSGTTLLRVASRLARINAARHRPDEVTRALAIVETAPTELTPDEPGVLGFDFAMAARNVGDAHYDLGGAEHLDAAVEWARIALDTHSAEAQPKSTYIAAARFTLAHAYLGKENLEAVAEHLASILHTTSAEYRTVPVIGRARSLHTLLTQHTDLASPTLTTLRDDLAGFITHPAPTPPELEPGTTT
ncbi:MAG: hypothetical protein ACRDTC_12250 [Pseudonocardiaceae bacterium]